MAITKKDGGAFDTGFIATHPAKLEKEKLDSEKRALLDAISAEDDEEDEQPL